MKIVQNSERCQVIQSIQSPAGPTMAFLENLFGPVLVGKQAQKRPFGDLFGQH